jgi:hypothetical protein
MRVWPNCDRILAVEIRQVFLQSIFSLFYACKHTVSRNSGMRVSVNCDRVGCEVFSFCLLNYLFCVKESQSTERQMRTTGLSSCVLYSRLCWLPSSCEFSIGVPIEFSILLRRARTKLDWEFTTLYSVKRISYQKMSFSQSGVPYK